MFLRGYQTVVDLKKKDRKLNLDQTENSENTAYQFFHQVVKITKLLNLRYKNEKVSPEYSSMHVITFIVSLFFGFTLGHVVRWKKTFSRYLASINGVERKHMQTPINFHRNWIRGCQDSHFIVRLYMLATIQGDSPHAGATIWLVDLRTERPEDVSSKWKFVVRFYFGCSKEYLFQWARKSGIL